MTAALLDPPTTRDLFANLPDHEGTVLRVGRYCRSEKNTLGPCEVIDVNLTGALLGRYDEERTGSIVVQPARGGPIDLTLEAWIANGWRMFPLGAKTPKPSLRTCSCGLKSRLCNACYQASTRHGLCRCGAALWREGRHSGPLVCRAGCGGCS